MKILSDQLIDFMNEINAFLMILLCYVIFHLLYFYILYYKFYDYY